MTGTKLLESVLQTPTQDGSQEDRIYVSLHHADGRTWIYLSTPTKVKGQEYFSLITAQEFIVWWLETGEGLLRAMQKIQGEVESRSD